MATRLKNPISFETTFGTYVVTEQLGEGGAGRVYGGTGLTGSAIAVKVLAADRTNSDKRRRFQDEIAFLTRNRHGNIVSVLDHGLAVDGRTNVPFYVMDRYEGSLRDLMRAGITPAAALSFYSQLLDGVEAAHLKGVIHRDLKPENFLYRDNPVRLAVADFGTAKFTEDKVVSLTEPEQRLANFQYAAPEQRRAGERVTISADIWALGLILNEMFTGAVPYGNEYRKIADVSGESTFLDQIVAKMIIQAPSDRPASIAAVKRLIQFHRDEAVSLQRLSEIDGTVIKAVEIQEPLAETPPKLIAADWHGGILNLQLDRPVTRDWIEALHHMGSFSAVLGKPPQAFSFDGYHASVRAAEHEVQMVVDNFKTWLPMASRTLKNLLEEGARRDEVARKTRLASEREAEERRLRVNRNIKI